MHIGSLVFFLSLSTSLHMIELCDDLLFFHYFDKAVSAKCHQARAGYDQLDPTPTLSPKPPLPRLKTIPQRRPTPIGAPLPERELVTNAAAHPPSLSRPTPNPPSKRRRVTISGVALNASNLHSADGSLVRTPTYTHKPLGHTGSSTPISPVAMGFTIQRDDSTAIEMCARCCPSSRNRKP